MKTKFKFLNVLLAVTMVLAVSMTLGGCKTDSGDSSADARGRAVNQTLVEAGKVLGNVAVSSLLNIVQQEATGGKVDFASAASAGLWSNASTIIDSSAIQRVISAYSGEKLTTTAKVAADAFSTSGAPPIDKTNAIAAVISAGVGAPPAK